MRVTTVREDIESFLQDDDDMMKLCLTRKKELEQVQQQQLQQQQSRTDGQLHNHLAHRRHSIKPMLSWSVLVCGMTGPPKNLIVLKMMCRHLCPERTGSKAILELCNKHPP